MNDTPPTPQPLEFTPGMTVVMIVVMAFGLLGWLNSDREHEFAPTVRPLVTRVTKQAVRIPHCSLTVAPSGGWSHLKVENIDVDEVKFVNETAHTVAALTARPESVPEISGDQVQYEHVKITWLNPAPQLGGDRLLEGWIEQPSTRARLRILTRANNAQEDPSIAVLCDAIRMESR